jgi:mono/diheme cytochrome c family protein
MGDGMMKTTFRGMMTLLACAAFLCAPPAGAEETKAASAPKYQYIGAGKCKTCHMSAAKGNQHGQWMKTGHAKAYATLATPKAKELAEKAGVKGNPQEAKECLKCHVTGYGQPKEAFAASFAMTDGVGCESCHGPGSAYQKLAIMKDPKASRDNGLVDVTEKTCLGCHNKDFVDFKGFDFKVYSAKVAHPNPQRKAAGAK